MQSWFKNHWPPLTLLLFLILITYGNSLNNAFLSDDLAEIVNNPNIGNLGYAVTSHPFGFIRLIFYWLAFQLGGLNPAFFRSINLFFHIGSTFLVFSLFNFLYSRRLALIVALIFAVHPAISETVVWISGGMYTQYTFFFLLSFIIYLKSKNNQKLYFASIGAFLFSFMSHPQMPMALFLVFPLWEILFGNLKANWKKTVPFLILTVFFILLTLVSLPERTNTLQSVHLQERGIDNPFVLIPVAITSYFELVFFPKTLTLYHSELSFGQVEFIIRFVVTLIFLAALFLSFKKSKFIFFWLSLFLIALSPTLTPFRLNWIVAERYLYLPSIGLFAVFALGLDKLADKKQFRHIVFIFFTAVIILLSARTIARNIDWKNENNLWIATGKTSPSSPNAHNNLGDVYGRLGDKQRALEEFQTAILLKPNYADAYHNLANTYVELDQLDKALENYLKAAQFNPGLWQSYQNIAAIYLQDKEYRKAAEYMEKAILVNPGNLNLRVSLGIIHLSEGEKDKAEEIFMWVLSIDPQNQFARAGLAEISK